MIRIFNPPFSILFVNAVKTVVLTRMQLLVDKLTGVVSGRKLQNIVFLFMLGR